MREKSRTHLHVTEHEFEPVPGLPDVLPRGEHILWQGSPDWRAMARHVFHVRKVAIYFGLLTAWRIWASLSDGMALGAALQSCFGVVTMGAIAIALLMWLSWSMGTATIYTLTNRRLVFRFGVALTLAVNFPLHTLRSAAHRTYRDGTGDIPLRVEGFDSFGYLMMWPHARPWRFGDHVEPMIRCVRDSADLAEQLAHAVARAELDAPRRIERELDAAPAIDSIDSIDSQVAPAGA